MDQLPPNPLGGEGPKPLPTSYTGNTPPPNPLGGEGPKPLPTSYTGNTPPPNPLGGEGPKPLPSLPPAQAAKQPADHAGSAPVTQSPAGNGPPTQITPTNPTASSGGQEVKFPKFNKLQASIFITKLSIPKLKIYVRKAPDYLRYTKQGNIEEKIIDFFNQPGCQNAKAAFESSPFGANPAMLATHISNAV